MVSAPAGNSVPSTIVTCGPDGATVVDSSVVMGASVAAVPEVSLESDDPPHAAKIAAQAATSATDFVTFFMVVFLSLAD
jgi:hypothetical protein